MSRHSRLTSDSIPVTAPESVPHYECQRCGNCCRWPGLVLLGHEEVDRLAGFLELPVREFVDQYCELLPNRSALTLVAKPDQSCIFLHGINQCRVQPVKPRQCRNFPNGWNFPGWRNVCEAIPVARPSTEPEVS